MQIKYLSHPIEKKIPIYGNSERNIVFEQVKNLNTGDSCNVVNFTLENHWGTHIDCPRHFFEDGKCISDYPAEFWYFCNPQTIMVDLKPSQIMDIHDFIEPIKDTTDLLIIKSGWEKRRGTEEYSTDNPGISPVVGQWLRKQYPNIKVIGFDWISLSSYKQRGIGREAHKEFLREDGIGKPILLLEDMKLGYPMNRLESVWIGPLVANFLDSAPCTVMGVFL